MDSLTIYSSNYFVYKIVCDFGKIDFMYSEKDVKDIVNRLFSGYVNSLSINKSLVNNRHCLFVNIELENYREENDLNYDGSRIYNLKVQLNSYLKRMNYEKV